MFIHVDDVRCAEDYALRIVFDNGVVKVVDLDRELDGPVFAPLRDPALFRQVAVNRDTGTIEWPNGADFAPEFLYDIGETVAATLTRKVAEEPSPYGHRT